MLATVGVLLRIAARVLGIGNGRDALRDASALDGALARAYSPALPDDIDIQAAALLHSLLTLRPFTDGNKRIAWLACDVFCTRGGARLDAYSALEAFTLTEDIESGRLKSLEDAAARLRNFRGEQPG